MVSENYSLAKAGTISPCCPATLRFSESYETNLELALVLQAGSPDGKQALKRAHEEKVMSNHEKRVYGSLAFFAVVLTLPFMVSCGGNNSSMSALTPSSTSTTGAVTTSLTDPPTCMPPNGTYNNVWVTITKVTANTSGTAGPTDSGWQTLADLTSKPLQVDLLSLSSTPAMLGSVSGLPPGSYQQLRVYLLSNTPGGGVVTPATNHCGNNAFNCVVRNGGTEALDVSSASQIGIGVPSGQITGGALTLAPNQAATVDVDFDACDSIVPVGGGVIRMKPVVQAGVISPASNTISGRVVDNSNPPKPIPSAIVMVEQPDPRNIDRVARSGLTAADGTFSFSSLPSGNYDVVAAASTFGSDARTVYGPTVTLKVPAGANVGDIPLIRVTANPPYNMGTLAGVITATSSSSDIGADVDLNVWALQPIGNGNTLIVTSPILFSSSAMSTNNPLPTSSDSGQCGTGSGVGCTRYTLTVPPANPQVGTFSVTPPTAYIAPAPPPAIYWVDARAFVPMSAATNQGSADCSPAEQPQSINIDTKLEVSPPQAATMNLSFSGCQE